MNQNTLLSSVTTTRAVSARTQVALAAAATAAVAALVGILQLGHEPSGDSTVVGVEHLIIGCLSAVLVLQLPVLWWVARGSRRRWPAIVAAAGMLSLAVVATQSNIQGHDPSYFAVMALPANALWFAGLVCLAVTQRRHGTVRRPLGVLLPLTWLALIPLSSLGGGLLAAAYFARVAWLAHTARLVRP